MQSQLLAFALSALACTAQIIIHGGGLLRVGLSLLGDILTCAISSLINNII